MRFSFLLILLLGFSYANGQDAENIKEESNKYLEDQIFIGFTYNFLTEKPLGVVQRNLSYGLQLGLIKDIPLNPQGTISVGLGLGLGYNTYFSNLVAKQENDYVSYAISGTEPSFKRSKLEMGTVEVPIEFRLRNSNLREYKFWRVYMGFKVGYSFVNNSKTVFQEKTLRFSNRDIQKFQYGPTFSFGYNTFNVYVHYLLNNLINSDVTIGDNAITLQGLRIGAIFYIL